MTEISQIPLLVSGLRYVSEYLDQEGHDRLWVAVDAQPWQWLGQRRVQHHGYGDSQAKGGVYRIGELPAWARELAVRLWRDGHMSELADQMIVTSTSPDPGFRSTLTRQCSTTRSSRLALARPVSSSSRMAPLGV